MAAPHADVSDVQVETKAEEVDTSASQTEAETLAKLEETRLSEEETARGDEARAFFRKYLNRNLKVEITDGRILIGIFLCTDRDANVVLGSCKEYASPKSPLAGGEPRSIGLVMVPERHIVEMYADEPLYT